MRGALLRGRSEPTPTGSPGAQRVRVAIGAERIGCSKTPKGWECAPDCVVDRHRPGYRPSTVNRTRLWAETVCIEGHRYEVGHGCPQCARSKRAARS